MKSGKARYWRTIAIFAMLTGALLMLSAIFSDLAFQRSPKDHRTLVTRISDAISHRYRQLSSHWNRLLPQAASHHSPHSKNRNKTAPKLVTGPAIVSVTDARQRPLKDASVTFQVHGTSHKQRFKTDSHGLVSQRLAPGLYDVMISHPKFSSELRVNQQIAGTKSGFSLHVILSGTVDLAGSVVDEEGKPVAGAAVDGKREWMVQFHEGAEVFLDDAGYRTVLTSRDGTFTLKDVSLGQSVITANASGYAETTARTDIHPGTRPPTMKLLLKRPSSIRGSVLDERLQPVSGVTVTALRFHPYAGVERALPSSTFRTITASDGTFTLKKLYDSGTYDLQIEHAQYATMEFANVAAGTANLALPIQRGGEISGTIEYIDRLTTPAHVIIQATAVINGTTITRAAVSDGVGRFQFLRLPYGSYRLDVDSNGIVSEARPPVSSARNKPARNVLVEVYEAGRISGSVLDAATDDPVPDARIMARVSYGYSRVRTRTFSTSCTERGQFIFPRVPSGQCVMSATSPGFLPSAPDDDSTFFLDPGGAEDDTQVFISRGGKVQGTVVDDAGQPIANAGVQLYVASGSFSGLNVRKLNATTDGAGAFEIGNFPVGPDLQMYASASVYGYAKQNSPIIDLTPRQPEAVTRITMTPGGSITGMALDEKKHPIPDVNLTFTSRQFRGDPSPSWFKVLGDIEGRYQMDRCTPGAGIIVAERPGFVRASRSVTVRDGVLLKNQNFTLKAGYGISGTVNDYRGKPIADARVRAYPLTGATGSGSDLTDKTGAFSIQDVSLGNFRLEATFRKKTPDGTQTYTFINQSVPSNSAGVPVDCDLEPELAARVGGTDGSKVRNFTFDLRSRLDTQPTQLFRFNLKRAVKNSSFFRILAIPRGLYYLKITAPGYKTYETDNVIVGPSKRTVLPTIRLEPGSSFSGRLISSTTGKPVKGAIIRLLDPDKPTILTVNRIELSNYNRSDILEYLNSAYDQDIILDPDPLKRLIARVRGNVVNNATSDFKGRFTLDGMGSGEYSINIDHPDYESLDMPNIYIARKTEKDLGDIQLDPGGMIRGQVMDDDGNGIFNAAMQVKDSQVGRNRAHTDTAGNFKFRGITPGRWPVTVRVALNGRTVYRWKFAEVRPGETSPIVIVLDTAATVSGTVSFSNGKASSGTVRYYVVDETGTAMDDLSYSAKISKGSYKISGIPTGHYFVVSTGKGKSGAFTLYQWVDAEAGSNRINLEGGTASLSGTAISQATGKPTRAQLQFMPDVPGVILPEAVSSQLRRSVTANTKGNFSAVYLQPGIWRVWLLTNSGAWLPVDALTLSDQQKVTRYHPPVP